MKDFLSRPMAVNSKKSQKGRCRVLWRGEEDEMIREPGERIPEVDEPERPELQLSRQERRWVALGALKSALLIGFVYLAGIGLIIWLMLALWL